MELFLDGGLEFLLILYLYTYNELMCIFTYNGVEKTQFKAFDRLLKWRKIYHFCDPNTSMKQLLFYLKLNMLLS